jgi:glycosyltransferase involved in cell wall biosynthesis
MKVLQIHNRYRNYGGEDVVVDNEYKLLKENGSSVNQLFFSNESISPLRLFNNIEAFNKTLKSIDEFQPDVIHVHNLFYSASPSVLNAAKKRNIPVVMTLHNYRLMCPGALFLRDSRACTKCKNLIFPYYGVKHKCFQNSYLKSTLLASFIAYTKINKTWISSIDKFIVLTPFIKSLIIDSSLKISKDHIVVKPNSTDDILKPEVFRDDKNFLFIGRLSKEKGVEVMIEAFNKMPNIKLDIIGNGDLFEYLQNKANKNIIFHGAKDKGFIKEKLNQVKALIFPSIWYEGLPNTLIEAFSAGTPVIASNIENINQIVISGFNGVTFKSNDSDNMVKKILEFSAKNTKEYSLNARKQFEEIYTHGRNFKSLNEIYSNLK